MKLEQAQELQQNLAENALAALNRGESRETISKYEKAIQIIGSAYHIPKDTSDQWLGLIPQRRYELEEIQAGRPLPEYEPIDPTARWTGYDIFCVMMDLFVASIRVETADDREALLGLAQELMSGQNFQNWVQQCPAAAQRV